jgi:large subunit ribosomal protein L3
MATKGILGRKLGMTQVWDEENRVVPVTVIQAGPCRVVQLKTPERDGYSAVQLAFGETKPGRLNKPELGHLKTSRTPRRASTSSSCASTTLRVRGRPGRAGRRLRAGDRVDVTGISKGKGFAGAMQRHNFKGQGASHGNHKKHRSPARSAPAPRRARCSRA